MAGERETTAIEASELASELFYFKGKIDGSSSLKWCRNFVIANKGPALFNQWVQMLHSKHTEIKIVLEVFQKRKQHVWTPPMQIIKIKLEKLFDMKLLSKGIYRHRD